MFVQRWILWSPLVIIRFTVGVARGNYPIFRYSTGRLMTVNRKYSFSPREKNGKNSDRLTPPPRKLTKNWIKKTTWFSNDCDPVLWYSIPSLLSRTNFCVTSSRTPVSLLWHDWTDGPRGSSSSLKLPLVHPIGTLLVPTSTIQYSTVPHSHYCSNEDRTAPHARFSLISCLADQCYRPAKHHKASPKALTDEKNSSSDHDGSLRGEETKLTR